ncbi:hypothetical protein [Streptococcus parasuis]|uniref:hypothetical protein n=1 Tax=Streptococcus parasuis TaxID=1501662 RepID=UPI00289E1D9D|nr:hypothetical protein [Streptococcus parasuis]
MNKKEAIELLQEMSKESFKLAKIHAVYIDSIVEVVNEIDEPQKVVVPKFVGEWIDTLDEHGLFGLNYDVVDESVWNWVYENYDCNAKKTTLSLSLWL